MPFFSRIIPVFYTVLDSNTVIVVFNLIVVAILNTQN